MGRLIAHTGTHGAGKTTAALAHVREMMIQYPNLKIGLITGTARSCPFKINKDTTRDSQLWIFSKLMLEEIEKGTKYDLVISDRSLYDVIAYVAVGAKDYALARSMLDLLKTPRSRYSELIFHKACENEFCYNDGIRVIDVHFRYEVDRWLEKMYREEGIRFSYYKGGR